MIRADKTGWSAHSNAVHARVDAQNWNFFRGVLTKTQNTLESMISPGFCWDTTHSSANKNSESLHVQMAAPFEGALERGLSCLDIIIRMLTAFSPPTPDVEARGEGGQPLNIDGACVHADELKSKILPRPLSYPLRGTTHPLVHSRGFFTTPAGVTLRCENGSPTLIVHTPKTRTYQKGVQPPYYYLSERGKSRLVWVWE